MRPTHLLSCATALTLTLFVSLPAAAQPTAGNAAIGLPLDRELLFGNPEIPSVRISPDGRYIAFIKPWKETRNIWVKKATERFSAARLVTSDTTRPTPGFPWRGDNKFILYVRDNAGHGNFNVYAMNPAAAASAGREAPASRNLTDVKGARAIPYAIRNRTPDVIYVGLNDRDPAWHDVYKVSVSSGERSLVRRNTDRIANSTFDRDGNLREATRVGGPVFADGAGSYQAIGTLVEK